MNEQTAITVSIIAIFLAFIAIVSSFAAVYKGGEISPLVGVSDD